MKHTPEEIKYRLSKIDDVIGDYALEYITNLETENAELKAFKEKCRFNVSDICKDIETENKLVKAKEIMQQLIANAPNTYSGTNVELQQKKMFSFQDAVNKAEQFLSEVEK